MTAIGEAGCAQRGSLHRVLQPSAGAKERLAEGADSLSARPIFHQRDRTIR